MTTAAAQTDAFDTELAETLSEAGERAELVSCLALFRAFRLYFGAETEAGSEAGAREVDMTVVTAVIWQGATSTTLDEAMAEIVPLADTATELYTTRFEANHEQTGDLFDADLSDRLGTCDTLRTQLLEALP
jgi:hypothetical protein